MKGSTTCAGHTVAETPTGARGHGMPLLEGFTDEARAGNRRRNTTNTRAEMLLSTTRAMRLPAGFSCGAPSRELQGTT